VTHYGLLIDSEYPFLAYSPDGDVTMTTADGVASHALLEIKCPGSKRFREASDEPMYGLHRWPNATKKDPRRASIGFNASLVAESSSGNSPSSPSGFQA